MMPAPLRPDELPGLVAQQLIRTCQQSGVTRTQLAFYCAAAGVTDPIHYDSTFARQSGFADNVVNGSLRVAWMAQALHELALPRGSLVRLQCAHRGLMLVGATPCIEIRYQGHTRCDDGLLVELSIQTLIDGRACDLGTGAVLIKSANS